MIETHRHLKASLNPVIRQVPCHRAKEEKSNALAWAMRSNLQAPSGVPAIYLARRKMPESGKRSVSVEM